MMRILPSELQGCISLPPSKSHVQRMIAAALLANGESKIVNPGKSADVLSAVSIARACKWVNESHDSLLVGGNLFFEEHAVFDCGESALCARLFSPVLSTAGIPFTITGNKTLMKRPVVRELRFLSETGLIVKAGGDYLPFSVVSGKLKSGHYMPNATTSSQFISGLLMALPVCNGNSLLDIRNAVSRPYIDMTIELMKMCGVVVNENNQGIISIIGNQSYQSFQAEAEADWSSAAFWILAGALSGSVQLKGLNPESKQADSRVIQLMKSAGIEVRVSFNSVQVEKSNPQAFEFDFSDCPDLFPVAAVLAAFAKGRSVITGVSRLAYKESNRLKGIVEALQQVGVTSVFNDGRLYVEGGGTLRFAILDSLGDHRLAMAFSVMALASSEGLGISDTECVTKSYPSFFETLGNLGGKIQ